ncbi:MAG: isoprenoid biosynthesis glyoxalase ElbB [Bacteroidales bacterium]|jgi:enhancing lycopene biosynthesis protein 2|nr:isoprenoid biosynthesis glyoxalase ElbB [Bacteroidales bacterium]
MKKIAIIISGCGVYDGTEIHEATLSMLAIDQLGAKYEIFAPNINQHHVINHINGNVLNETRNVLVESARIARGNISDLKDFNSKYFDALLIPGGFGAAKNLSSYAFDGANMTVNKEVENAIKSMHSENKPIGALCIAPVLFAKIFSDSNITIGNDAATASLIKEMGAKHTDCNATGIVVDEKNKLISTPCYMLGKSISEVYEGAFKLVKELIKLS